MFYTVMILLTLNFLSCGRSDKINKETDQAKKPAASPNQQRFLQDVSKTWISKCRLSSDDLKEGRLYGISTITFTKTDFTMRFDIFNDSNCTLESMTTTLSGKYEVVDDAKNHAGGYVISTTTQTIEYTALDEFLISNLNLSNFCGISDWKKNEKRDLTSKKCTSTADIGKANKTILAVKGNQLHLFGDDKVGEKPWILYSK